MSSMFRLRVPWSGSAVVGGGVSTFIFDSSATAANITPAMNTFFNAIKGYVPSSVTWNIPNGGDLITSDTGLLTGSWTSGGSYTIVGTGSGSFASGVGARINWATSAIIGGRRLRGATAICPIVTTNYESDGTLGNAMVTAMNTAAAALVASSGVAFAVWHRPNPKGASNGAVGLVISGTVPDKVSWLRTRRT